MIEGTTVGDKSTREKVSSSSSHDDPSSPYFLHSEDHPGLLLVSTPVTSPDFNMWCYYIMTALTAKAKIAFVDGSISLPD